MEIRRLTIADAAAYRALRLRGLREHPDAFTSSWEEDSEKPIADSEARLASHQQRHWGAFVDGRLQGLTGLELLRRAKERHKGRVVGMYVAADRAGLGLGSALLAAAITEARRSAITDLVLTVSEGNVSAMHVYRKAGFTAFGTEPRAICVAGVYIAKVHMHLRVA